MDRQQESIICPGCACLCDDLDVSLAGDRLVEVHNVCRWGVSKFFSSKKFYGQRERTRLLAPQVRGGLGWEAAAYEDALAGAARLLAKARRPVLYGLTNCGCRAQEAALRLARRLKARLEPADLAFTAPYFEGVRRHGLFFAPLEVVRDQADTVVFWGANPLHSCPRHVVRYSVFARGRFTERGLEDRRVAAVDLYRTELAKFCRLFVSLRQGEELDLVRGVTALLDGGPAPADLPPQAPELADFLAQAAYGVIFLGRGVSYGPAAELLEALAGLTATLSRRAPVALFPLSGDFNATGLYQLFLRELGSPGAPDFGNPAGAVSRFEPVDFKEVDALLVAGADLFWVLPEDQAHDLRRRNVPIVALSPFANRTTAQAKVVLPVALEGVEVDEIACRMDGLPVVLKALLPAPAPPAWQVLEDLLLCV